MRSLNGWDARLYSIPPLTPYADLASNLDEVSATENATEERAHNGREWLMPYRIMQVAVSALGIVFALAAFRAINEPWRQMDSIMATQVAAGYLIAAIMAIICIVIAQRFGVKARKTRDSN
jgi:hypothetical protein